MNESLKGLVIVYRPISDLLFQCSQGIFSEVCYSLSPEKGRANPSDRGIQEMETVISEMLAYVY